MKKSPQPSVDQRIYDVAIDLVRATVPYTNEEVLQVMAESLAGDLQRAYEDWAGDEE